MSLKTVKNFYYTVGDDNNPWYSSNFHDHHCFSSYKEAEAELKFLQTQHGFKALTKVYAIDEVTTFKFKEATPNAM